MKIEILPNLDLACTVDITTVGRVLPDRGDDELPREGEGGTETSLRLNSPLRHL